MQIMLENTGVTVSISVRKPRDDTIPMRVHFIDGWSCQGLQRFNHVKLFGFRKHDDGCHSFKHEREHCIYSDINNLGASGRLW